ncbi:unnamed protein product [Mycena citricolor]|uniref:Uncharacterized protein n=1 Tax=Mycena citricolor TaxID=2018698 RepID=A0AAD2K5W3_9AGAR|nr:unnamed protein product [Mycena citricolor]
MWLDSDNFHTASNWERSASPPRYRAVFPIIWICHRLLFMDKSHFRSEPSDHGHICMFNRMQPRSERHREMNTSPVLARPPRTEERKPHLTGHLRWTIVSFTGQSRPPNIRSVEICKHRRFLSYKGWTWPSDFCPSIAPLLSPLASLQR